MALATAYVVTCKLPNGVVGTVCCGNDYLRAYRLYMNGKRAYPTHTWFMGELQRPTGRKRSKFDPFKGAFSIDTLAPRPTSSVAFH
jgi:hypothetical protein